MVQRTEAGKNMTTLTGAKKSPSLKEGDQVRDQTGASPDDELLNVREQFMWMVCSQIFLCIRMG